MSVSPFTQDLAYFAVSVLSDPLKLLAAGLLAASFLYALIIVTVFVIRNE